MPRTISPPKTPKDSLHRQGYNFIAPGATAAVKPCMWCKRALRGGDQCYKHQFYGIESWRCVQMTPTLRCNQRCLFCWRSMEHEVETETELSPQEIIDAIPRVQRKGLSGDKPWSEPDRWETATSHPNQYAISLSGEPTLYSRLPELIDLLREAGNSVFVVSNGTVPEMIQKLRPTQLYISLDAADAADYTELCRPMGDPDQMWANIRQSLTLLSEREETAGVRTAIRTTLVKGYNDTSAAGLAALIRDAAPRYVEIKGYMYLGYSRTRLPETAVPDMDEIRTFARSIAEHADYRILDENAPSRVVCLERKP